MSLTKLKLYGIEDFVYFFFCDTDITFGNFNIGMIENFIQEQKALGAMTICIVNVATESFSERMG